MSTAALPPPTPCTFKGRFCLRRPPLLGGGLVALAMGIWSFWAAATEESLPLEHQVYVWQRAWNDPVRQAVVSRGEAFSRIVVLAGEVTWKQEGPQIAVVEADDQALAKAARPVAFALRIGPFGGPFARSDSTVLFLKRVLRERIQRAAGCGLRPAEIQIDFDCAASKLDGYRLWIEALRQEFSPCPLTLTALPSWMSQPGFGKLVRATDGFVLQVHSLARPQSLESPFTLCDPQAALRAADLANRSGVPFLVALPTYGYLCAFDQRSQFLGLSAEGPRPEWPAQTRFKEVRAEEGLMSQLVRRWTTNRPPQLRGIIWYRLPVDGDRLNWTWPTLQAVIAGTPLDCDLQAAAQTEDSLLFEIDLRNRGTSAALHPAQILVRWRGSRLVAADGLAGFVAEDEGSAEIRFSLPTGSLRLEPGRRQPVGWVRFSKPTEVSVEVLPTTR